MEITAESPTRRSNSSSSPDFEFWMLRNPPSSDAHLPLLSADELFSDGVLLPLCILSHNPAARPSLLPPPPPPEAAAILPCKKWKDMFKSGEKKPAAEKKDRKPFPTVASPEINIHIWPFSRSRSAGNNRPRAAATAAGRKTSSAPCSRCNSQGDSSKNNADGAGAAAAAAAAAVSKWAPNPGRGGGIYLGRSNPVWQFRRRNAAVRKKDIGGAGDLKINVNTSVRHQIPASCRECDKDAKAVLDERRGGAVAGDGGKNVGGGGGEINGGLFKLKAIFTRKVY